MVRISFVLGNLTAKSDLSRSRLFQQPKSLDTLLAVLKYYLEIDSKSGEASKSQTEGATPDNSKTEDVLIKVIRVIANMSINEEIGAQIATNENCVKLLLVVLGE